MNEILEKLREDKGLKQVELAEQIHISSSAISKYEGGRSVPEFETLFKLAEFFEVNLDYLFGRTEIKPTIKKLEGKLKTRSGLVPIDILFELNDADKEIIGLLLKSLYEKEEYQNKNK